MFEVLKHCKENPPSVEKWSSVLICLNVSMFGGMYVPLYQVWLFTWVHFGMLCDKCELKWGYVHGYLSMCVILWLSDASKLSASQTPWLTRACGVAVQPLVPSTRALSLHQHSQCLSLWVIGLGARALYLSQPLILRSFTLTLMTITRWPLQLRLEELTSAFTSVQTVSVHILKPDHDPPL